MKRCFVVFLLALTAPALAPGQNAGPGSRANGYIFIGQGYYSVYGAQFGIGHVGGGGQYTFYKNLGVDAELGAMGRAAEGVGLFSVDPFYRFASASRHTKLVPFVTAGYTRAFEGSRLHALQQSLQLRWRCGVLGVQRVGLRIDFRDYVDQNRISAYSHYPAIRVGLLFRAIGR